MGNKKKKGKVYIHTDVFMWYLFLLYNEHSIINSIM